jgi:hypothetical protein
MMYSLNLHLSLILVGIGGVYTCLLRTAYGYSLADLPVADVKVGALLLVIALLARCGLVVWLLLVIAVLARCGLVVWLLAGVGLSAHAVVRPGRVGGREAAHRLGRDQDVARQTPHMVLLSRPPTSPLALVAHSLDVIDSIGSLYIHMYVCFYR